MSNEKFGTDIVRIPFHSEEIWSLRDDRTGKEYVVPKPLCDMFELVWHSQYKKLTTNKLFRKGVVKEYVPTAGGPQEMIVLERRLFHPWLLSLDVGKMRVEYREKLLLYQEQAAQALD